MVFETKKHNYRFNTWVLLALGFLGVIIIGAVLLMLPVCNREPIAPFDAFFMATTAVCVTGLVTVTPATQFTLLGKCILLILIQIGGLGVIGCVTLFFFLLRRQMDMKQQMVLQESYNTEGIAGVVLLVKKILLGTFLVEGAGAVCYAFTFVPRFGLLKGIFYSVFHAISAFCNAGIDVLGADSLAGYVTDVPVNITTILLIVVSGIGFTVWFDVLDNMRKLRQKNHSGKGLAARLTLHSKAALTMTGILLAGGWILNLLLEWDNPGTLGSLEPGQKILAAAFQSVTTRTAGFYTFSQGAMHQGTKLLNCLLMFIGGSPGGTAGGVKTTTILVLLLSCITLIRGGEDTELFGRRISGKNVRTCFALVTLAFLVLITGTVLIAFFEGDGVPLSDILYETTSAIGTVGLSADLTASLHRASQAVIMVMMYIGRLGPMTLALVFVRRKNPRDKIRRYPEDNIMIG